MIFPDGPWTAPSAGVYAADGELVCTLGTVEVTDAYRKRGDGAGRMVADTATLIAAAPLLLDAAIFALQSIEFRDGLRGRMDLFTADERAKIRAAVTAATVRQLSPSERGETFTVPTYDMKGGR